MVDIPPVGDLIPKAQDENSRTSQATQKSVGPGLSGFDQPSVTRSDDYLSDPGFLQKRKDYSYMIAKGVAENVNLSKNIIKFLNSIKTHNRPQNWHDKASYAMKIKLCETVEEILNRFPKGFGEIDTLCEILYEATDYYIDNIVESTFSELCDVIIEKYDSVSLSSLSNDDIEDASSDASSDVSDQAQYDPDYILLNNTKEYVKALLFTSVIHTSYEFDVKQNSQIMDAFINIFFQKLQVS